MTKDAKTIADRKDLATFLRDIPQEMAGYPILAVGRFEPGDEAYYAAAYVVTLAREPQRESHRFNVHTLTRVDDGPSGGVTWRLLAGTYDTTFENAAGMAFLGAGLVEQYELRTKAAAAVRADFKAGTAHAVYVQEQRS